MNGTVHYQTEECYLRHPPAEQPAAKLQTKTVPLWQRVLAESARPISLFQRSCKIEKREWSREKAKTKLLHVSTKKQEGKPTPLEVYTPWLKSLFVAFVLIINWLRPTPGHTLFFLRRDYLTGFQKRKKQRRKKAQLVKLQKAKELLREMKREVSVL